MGAALDLIKSLGGKDYSVTRFAAGSYSTSLVAGGGVYAPGAPTVVTVTALVQPLTDRELATLSEGDRLRQGWSLWSEAELRTGDETGLTRADTVTIDGEKHQVVKVAKWGGDIPHFRSIALRLEEQT